MILVQISDTHITRPDELAYGRFDTTRALERVVSAINAMQPCPDLVLHTGDITSHGSTERYDRFFTVVEKLRAPLYLMPGNHDERGALAA
ncbi:MAG: metallophosphoesterase, partial [Gammaproteobacteria bacterium]|nr:metallophosphoesterase [Gammaproteobacteria bacterium]